MKSAVGSLLFLGSLASSVLAAPSRIHKRGSEPNLPFDPNTVRGCTWWIDYEFERECDEIILNEFTTLEDFIRWNPSLSGQCEGMEIGKAYCVEANNEGEFPEEPEESETATATPTPTTTPTPTDEPEEETETPTPTPTKPSNGIETPEPVQPNIVDNCDLFYFVKDGDTCDKIAAANGITVEQFQAWNRNVGSTCAGLWADTYACISVIGHTPSTPTPTKPGNGITTPSPIQPNMVDNCDAFYMVKSGDNCDTIAAKSGITTEQFKAWNRNVGNTCAGLWAETYACISVIGHTPSTPTPVNPGNGITTPTPTQPNIVDNCDSFYMVKSGDTCDTISAKSGITVAQFKAWNRNAGTTCNGLWANAYACISIIGHTPTPVNPGNGITTPTPIQSGMVTNCKTFHFVRTGESCATIGSRYGVSTAQLARWNPAIGSTCTGMWANTYLCVATL